MKSIKYFFIALVFATGLVACNNAAEEPETIEIEETDDNDNVEREPVMEEDEDDGNSLGIDVEADEDGNVDGKVDGNIRLGDKDKK